MLIAINNAGSHPNLPTGSSCVSRKYELLFPQTVLLFVITLRVLLEVRMALLFTVYKLYLKNNSKQ